MARFHRLHRLGNWPRWRSCAALLALGLAAHAPAGAWEASGTQTITAYLQARLQLLLDLGILATQGSKFWLEDPLASRLTPDMRGPGPLQMPDNELIPPDRFLEPNP